MVGGTLLQPTTVLPVTWQATLKPDKHQISHLGRVKERKKTDKPNEGWEEDKGPHLGRERPTVRNVRLGHLGGEGRRAGLEDVGGELVLGRAEVELVLDVQDSSM